jgi:hypothetical protein
MKNFDWLHGQRCLGYDMHHHQPLAIAHALVAQLFGISIARVRCRHFYWEYMS